MKRKRLMALLLAAVLALEPGFGGTGMTVLAADAEEAKTQAADAEEATAPKITGAAMNKPDGTLYSDAEISLDVDFQASAQVINVLAVVTSNGQDYEYVCDDELDAEGTATIALGDYEGQHAGDYQLKEILIQDADDNEITYTYDASKKILVNAEDETDKCNTGDLTYTISRYEGKGLAVDYKLNLPDGMTADNIAAGTEFSVTLTLKNETDKTLQLVLTDTAINWEYKDGYEQEYLSASAGNESDEDRGLDIGAGETEELTIPIKTGSYTDDIDATFASIELPIVNEEGYEKEYGCKVINGKVVQYIDGKEAAILSDYDGKMDFFISASGEKDKKQPKITGFSRTSEDPVYTGSKVEYKVDYEDDLSGVKSVELDYTNEDGEQLSVDGEVEEELSCSGTVTADVKLDDQATGTYKLTEATVTDYSGQQTIYSLNEDGSLLVGDDGEDTDGGDVTEEVTGSTLTPDSFDVQYMDKALKIKEMKLVSADGKETNKYVTGDTAKMEVTFKNNTDAAIDLKPENLNVALTALDLTPENLNKTISGENMQADMKVSGDEVTIPAGDEKTVAFTVKLTEEMQGNTYHFYDISYDVGEGAVFYYQFDDKDVMHYQGNQVKVSLDVDKLSFSVGDGSSESHIHNFKEYITKATTSEDGKIVVKCADPACGEVKSEKVIPHPEDVELEEGPYIYNGTDIKPSLKVMGSDGKEISEDNYIVTYPEECSEVGYYEINIKFTGKYYEGGKLTGYDIVEPRPDTVLENVEFEKTEYDTKGTLHVTVEAEAKNGVSRMDLVFPSEEDDQVYTLQPTEMRNYGEIYEFFYDLKELPYGDNYLDRVVFYDKTDVKTAITYSYNYDEEEKKGYFDLESEDLEYQTSVDNNLFVHLHNFQENIEKAKPGEDGYASIDCEECGDTKEERDIAAPEEIVLSPAVDTYNGKAKTPKVKITGSDGKTIAASNYKVIYASGRKNVGRYAVTVQFTGKYYAGKMTKTFDILPKGTSVSSAKAAKKAMTVKWKKQASQTSGYQLQYSQKSNFKSGNKTVTVSKNSITSKKITKLTSKKTYYVRIRTYKTVKYGGKSIKLYSAWSKATKAKIK